MPTIHFKCQTCGMGYNMLVYKNDAAKPSCPKCKSHKAKPLPKSKRLFDSTTPLTALPNDTN